MCSVFGLYFCWDIARFFEYYSVNTKEEKMRLLKKAGITALFLAFYVAMEVLYTNLLCPIGFE
jgi:hypothetical protein